MSIAERILVIDCQSAGVSGNMILGSLLDLDGNTRRITDIVGSIKSHLKGCRDLNVSVSDVARRGFRGKYVEVKAEEEVTHRTGVELREVILSCVEHLALSDQAKRLAVGSINTLISAEAKAHGENIEEVHLHEAGSADTVVDIVGTVVALEDLGLLRNATIYSTPVAVGGGLFKFSHGMVPSPAPATIEILRSKNFPMIGGPINAELTTPTGASLLVNMVDVCTQFYPPMKPLALGYGAGTKDFGEMPNLLRTTLGEPLSYDLLIDEICILETNLDDVTGEVIGHTIDRLLDEGARDVSVIPMFTKKNRPGQIFEIITDKENAERLSRVLMEETGTLGVRVYPCKRHILVRETIPMEIKLEGVEKTIRVKISRDREGKIIQVKPEYEDIKRLAKETGKPLRLITEQITEKVKQVLPTT